MCNEEKNVTKYNFNWNACDDQRYHVCARDWARFVTRGERVHEYYLKNTMRGTTLTAFTFRGQIMGITSTKPFVCSLNILWNCKRQGKEDKGGGGKGEGARVGE